MVSSSLLSSIAIVLHNLCGAVLGYRLPVDEVFRKELQKRLVCVEDDVLLSFQQYTEDSLSFCSTYLSIPLSTGTVTTTSRTFASPYSRSMASV